jgi:O-acetyl-ADP-ribose deacetylase (regulator of RNase III)
MSLTPEERRALDAAPPSRATIAMTDVPGAVDAALRALAEIAPGSAVDARRRLQALLTRAAPGSLPASAWPSLDAIFATEAAARRTTCARALPRLATAGFGAHASLWRGDITTLEAGAIVNAANEGLTGCYAPFHRCVDNAIHSAAGPRLREACGAIMAARGRPEPTATATVTRGAFLPARFVLHTVGPIVDTRAPTAEHASLLARAYAACLERAADVGAEEVAFPSLSTGVFGYPIALASRVAIAAVRAFVERSAAPPHVVFVTYSAEDTEVYERALEEVCR